MGNLRVYTGCSWGDCPSPPGGVITPEMRRSPEFGSSVYRKEAIAIFDEKPIICAA
ncbi:hypothetical protein [Laspinema palackyanum]|uniref:hypothetical protein n=1 Tax=Laspinema palackyanum TaxID=3231601 RepID=UPI00345DD470|nr:hypothetical protein [Laspinema sp. D2c]